MAFRGLRLHGSGKVELPQGPGQEARGLQEAADDHSLAQPRRVLLQRAAHRLGQRSSLAQQAAGRGQVTGGEAAGRGGRVRL